MTRAADLRFTLADQRWFAKLSGDVNPVHLDPAAARRVAAGEPIVHGVHLLLRALDRALAPTNAAALAVDAAFVRPAVLDAPIRIEAHRSGEIAALAEGDVVLLRAGVRRASGHAARQADIPSDGPVTAVPRQPAIRTLDEIARLHGALPVPRALPLRRAFPRAARALGADALCALTAISALVGMECPGRESLLSAVRVRIARGVRPGCIRWRVAHVDRRFGLVRIEIAGDGISGSVEAFVRPQPAAPPSMAAAARGIDPQEFAGQRALIVGGSRGLGAAAALLIAAGGGVPIVTYASGANEAAALRRDARAAGRALDIVRLDVTAPKTAARIGKIAARHRVTHLYYCATPRIFATRRPPFDSTRFDRFANVYVRAFADVCVAAKRPAETLDVFYPSTVAVADTPAELTEYAAAKAAGESLCRALEQSTDGLRVLVSRLPRVATDQTASIVPAAALDPLEAMRPIVRAMQRRRRTGPR